MKIRKIAIAALSVVVAGSLLTACGGGNSKSDDNGKTKVTFWAAPNPTQVKYWDEMAKAYEKENPDVTIEVSQMKEIHHRKQLSNQLLPLKRRQQCLKISIVVSLRN